jgi:hypothetical protein
MKKKITRPKCVLLDAMIIITAHEKGIWLSLIEAFEIVVSSIIARDEALFYSEKEGGIPKAIDLPKLTADGKITELAATVEELKRLSNIFDPIFIEGLHAGESEALALLLAGKAGEALFCTSDAKAIQALAMIGLSEQGISFERLIKTSGLSRDLPDHFGEYFFKRNIRSGQENRLTGAGMRKNDNLNKIGKRNPKKK